MPPPPREDDPAIWLLAVPPPLGRREEDDDSALWLLAVPPSLGRRREDDDDSASTVTANGAAVPWDPIAALPTDTPEQSRRAIQEVLATLKTATR